MWVQGHWRNFSIAPRPQVCIKSYSPYDRGGEELQRKFPNNLPRFQLVSNVQLLWHRHYFRQNHIYMTAMDKVNKGLRIWKQAEEIFIFLNYLRAKCLVFCTTRMTSKFTLEKWRGAGGEDSVLSHPNHKTENANKDLWLCICRQAEIVLHQCSSRKSQTRATIKSFEERAPFYGFQLLCSVQLVSVQYNQTHWWLGDPVTLTGPR